MPPALNSMCRLYKFQLVPALPAALCFGSPVRAIRRHRASVLIHGIRRTFMCPRCPKMEWTSREIGCDVVRDLSPLRRRPSTSAPAKWLGSCPDGIDPRSSWAFCAPSRRPGSSSPMCIWSWTTTARTKPLQSKAGWLAAGASHAPHVHLRLAAQSGRALVRDADRAVHSTAALTAARLNSNRLSVVICRSTSAAHGL
jgi:hypothetical protein